MTSDQDFHANSAHSPDHGAGTEGHGHGHGHGHGNGNEHDMWAGQDYLSKPGVQDAAVVSADSVVYALSSVGLSEGDMKKMDVLEVGCGPGVVTTHLLKHFKTIHSIDTSPSMLQIFSQIHTSESDRLTYSLHSLSPLSSESFNSRVPQLSTTADDEKRMIVPPRSKFDLAIANLVLHHVDDLDEFMKGVIGLLKSNAWVVFTEVGQEAFNRPTQSTLTGHGSVNAPDHFHATLTPAFLSDLVAKYGLIDVHTEFKGTVPVFGLDGYQPPCLIIRARKP